ncbi:LuxR C-terminal-related transcriptional regulator [Flavobacteriaceae bacterium GSB9]|nr:LuxR C-terminal-related transcriptional regulator [Flavobacteriaceae bacterium GSB9]
MFSPGACYYFIFNFNNLTFEILKGNIENVLGILPEEMNLQYFFKILHPEDLEKYHEKEKVGFDFLMNHIPTEDIPLYKVVYLFRLKHKNGGYKTIMHQSRTVNVSQDGRVQQVLCVHTDLTSYNTPIYHSISFLSDSRTSYFSVTTDPPYTFKENVNQFKFTKREKEIILEMTKGKTPTEIANTINIALSTVNTHKRNI